MWKKLVSRSLLTVSVLVCASFAMSAQSNADSMSTKVKGVWPKQIDAVGVNEAGTAYEAKGLMGLDANIQVIIDTGATGRVMRWRSWLLLRTEDTDWVKFNSDFADENYSIPRPKNVNTVKSVHIPNGADVTKTDIQNLPFGFAPLMVAYCNRLAHRLRGQGKSNEEIFSQDRTVHVAVGSAGWGSTTLSRSITFGINVEDDDDIHHNVDFSLMWKLSLNCKGRPTQPPQTAGALKFDAGPLEAKTIDLALNTHPAETHQKHPGGPRCPVLYVRTTITSNKAGLIKAERVRQLNGGSSNSDDVYINTTFQGENTFSGVRVQKYYLDDGDHVRFYAKVQSGGSVISAPWQDVTIQCTPSGSGLSHDTSDYEATATMELLDVDAGKVNDTTCPRNARAVFAFTSNYSFPISYHLTSNTGISKSGTLEMFKSGEEWKGLAVVPFPINESVSMGAVLKQNRNGINKIVAVDTKDFNCVTPIVNNGSNDLAPTQLPDPNTPRSPWSGEVIVADTSGPKVCPREGQTFFEVKSSAPGSFDYRLNCSNGQFFTGSKSSFGTPGNYKAFGAHNIDITKNRNIQCTLQEVRPNGVRITVAEGDHDFGCKTEIPNAGSNNLATSELPDDDRLPAVKEKLTGDFFYVDNDAPTCGRTAKALLAFRTNKPDDIRYTLSCKPIFHPFGVVTPTPHPQGGYSAVAVVNFDVKETYNTSCTLEATTQIIKKPISERKRHQFICKTPTTNPGPDDKTTTPGSTSTTTPKVAIACKSNERRVGNNCVKIPSVSILCKPGFVLKGESCVKKPAKRAAGSAGSATKAAEASRIKKRRQAEAAKRRKADAARAADRRKKAAQAAKRRKAQQDAARAAQRRKATADAAARRRVEQRTRARRAEARRKASSAAKRRAAPQRRSTIKRRRNPAGTAVR